MGSTAKEAVLNVFAGLVRPLMKVAFEYGISAGELSGVVRRVYIQALEARLNQQKRPTTDARLAVVTGIPRAEVGAIREAVRNGAPHGVRSSVGLDQISALLTVWHTHSSFSGAYGLPLDLNVSRTSGSPHRHFSELVNEACPGVDSDAVLDELIGAGTVEIIQGNTVRCLARAFVPSGEDVARIERMGRFLEILTANFVHNVLRSDDSPAYFERMVVSDFPLSSSQRNEFLETTREKGQALLTELDEFLAGLPVDETITGGKKYGVGVYFFEEQPSSRKTAHSTPEERNNTVDEKNKPRVIEEIDVLAPIQRRN